MQLFRVLKVFIGAGLAVIGVMLLPSFAKAATLALSPSSQTVNVGATLTVNIVLDTTGQSVFGVDIFSLRYDPTILQVQDANTSTSGVQIQPGTLMPDVQYNTVNTTSGLIQFSQTSSTSGSNFNGSGVLATVTFTTLRAGTANVTFDFTPGSTTDTNVAVLYNDVLTAVTNGSYTVSLGSDSTAPSAPSGLTATPQSTTAINLSWTASTDPTVAGQTTSGVSAYQIFRCTGSSCTPTTQIATSTTTSYANTGLSAATTYRYRINAVDGAGNVSANSSIVSGTTQSAPDTTVPTVSMSSPTNGQTVSGSITVGASASDPTVAGQTNSGLFLLTVYLDNVVYATSTTGSISRTLDTTAITNANHSFVAVARDNAGNQATSSSVSVTVYNLSNANRYPRKLRLNGLEGVSNLTSYPTATIQVISQSNQAVLSSQSYSVDASNDYTVSFDNAFPQVVSIRVRVSGYLSRMLTNVDTTVNSGTPLSVPQLLAGDFNSDGLINTLDYSQMNSNWNTNNPTVDINRDGTINSLDYAVLKNNWGRTGE